MTTTDPTLDTLLSQPLPRALRCDNCAHWQRDAFPSSEDGDCAEHERVTVAYQGCVYWSPRPGCGLDYMGIPLASPLAGKE